MKKNLKVISRRKIVSLSLVSLLLLSPVAGFAVDTTNSQQEQTVTMQLSQYNRLKQITEQQEMTLASLKTSINLLEQNSTADKKTLVELNNQLNNCQTRLTNAKNLLTQQSNKLAEANNLLQKNEEYLQTLTKQIKSLEHKLAVTKRQRDLWAVSFGGLLGYIILDKVDK